jgi:hypothetical protein
LNAKASQEELLLLLLRGPVAKCKQTALRMLQERNSFMATIKLRTLQGTMYTQKKTAFETPSDLLAEGSPLPAEGVKFK